MITSPSVSDEELANVKRRKLKIKDNIAQLEDVLLPDILA